MEVIVQLETGESVDLVSELRIDRVNLDVECSEQSAKFAYWATLAAEAEYGYEQTRNQLDLVKAQVDTEIRKTPEAFGISKVTDKTVESLVTIDVRYQNAVATAAEARRKRDIMRVAKDAFDQRNDMLKSLSWMTAQERNANVRHMLDQESGLR